MSGPSCDGASEEGSCDGEIAEPTGGGAVTGLVAAGNEKSWLGGLKLALRSDKSSRNNPNTTKSSARITTKHPRLACCLPVVGGFRFFRFLKRGGRLRRPLETANNTSDIGFTGVFFRRPRLAEVPCVRLEHMNKTEKRAFILADNRLAQLAGWDEDILSEEL